MHSNVTISRVNTTHACAACKYQRRKCPSDCILAPYFPPDRQRQFFNAHKLFGVSNITKIIRNLDQPDKDAAMRTIIFQSDVRASDPVGGCYRLVHQLQRQIDYTKAELDIVLRQLALCRAQAQTEARGQPQMLVLDDHDATDSTVNNSHDIFGAEPLESYEQQMLNSYHHLLQPQYMIQNDNTVSIQDASDSCNWGMQASMSMSSCNHLLQPQYMIQNDNSVSIQDVSDSCNWGMQRSMSMSSCMPLRKQRYPSECNNFKPLGLPVDDPKEMRFESEDKHERRDEAAAAATLKEEEAALKEDEESFQCGEDHDLKGAAALFTLTKCNNN